MSLGDNMDTKCKNIPKKSKQNPKLLLSHIVATTLDDELMDKFQISTNKRRLLRNLQCQYFKKNVNKEWDYDIIEYDPIPTKNTSHEDQRKYARKCPKNSLYVFPKDRILKLISPESKMKFPMTVNQTFNQIKGEFVQIIHYVSVNCKVSPQQGEAGLVVLQPFKLNGKTSNYPVFLKNRNQLKKRWQLHQDLIRCVVIECETFLPDILFDLKTLPKETNNLGDLNEKFRRYINNSAVIFSKLYERILQLVNRSQQRNRIILEICNAILCAYFMNRLMSTIDNLVHWTSIENPISYIKMNIFFDKCLSVEPTVDDVVGLYSIFIYELTQIADDLNKYGSSKPLPILITDDYFDAQKEKIRKNITKFYTPIFNYLQIIDEEFIEIYNKRIEDFDTLTFELGCEIIETCQEYIKKTTEMIIDNKYINFGQLTDCLINNLKQSLQDYIDEIFQHLVVLHQRENELICNEFELIKEKLLEIPQNTSDLIAQGKYVIYVKTIYLNELRDRIEVLTDNLVELINFGDLTPEHMSLNATTILWLREIEPFFDQNSVSYEQLKAEAEERMFSKINKVTDTLNGLFAELRCLNVMDDFDYVREYLRVTSGYYNCLRDIQFDINWINSEETLLSYRRTSFDRFGQVVNFLLPFHNLLRVCLDITRKINVWLYGQFEFLDSTEAEEFLEKAMENLNEIEKNYREMLRKQEVDLRFEGFVDHSDVDKWPTPLKLINAANEKLEEFQPSLKWMKIWCNPNVTKEQWREMSAIAGVDLTPTAGTTLKKLIDLDLTDFEEYAIICNININDDENDEEDENDDNDDYDDNNSNNTE